jgi:carbon storage regulator CsrA
LDVVRNRGSGQLQWKRLACCISNKGGLAMLVLSRQSRESVVVGGSDGIHRLLKVTVLAIQGPSVKLGFEVDEEVPVRPSELREQINFGSQPSGAE